MQESNPLSILLNTKSSKNLEDLGLFSQQFENKDPTDGVSFVYNFMKNRNFFPPIECSWTKSTAEALEYKYRGNEAFYRGEDVEALKLYTRSAAAALPGSPELAAAYARRSLVLFRLGRYEACVVDINRALKGKYPEDSKPELFDRKRNAWSKLKQRNATDRIKLKHLERSASDDDGLKQYLRYRIKELEFDVEATDMDYDGKFYPPEVKYENTNIRNASKKLKINFTQEMGRHVVAVEDIEPGEILAVEEPYASLLDFDCRYSHCSNCYVRCESLIPCHTCSLVMFCSERCRENSFNRFHRIECPLLSNAISHEFSEPDWLTLRLLLIATKQGEELETLMQHPLYKYPLKKIVGDFEKFDCQSSANILNLEDNLEKHPDLKLLRLYALAAFLLHLLKNSEYFGNSSDENKQNSCSTLTNKELYVGKLLLKFHLVILCNGYKIGEIMDEENPGVVDMKCGNIGTGLYSFHSLFNHSCYPNVSVNFHKDTIVSFSLNTIKAGQQLLFSYIPYNIRSERQKMLRENYYFTCRCKACEHDWPNWKDTHSLSNLTDLCSGLFTDEQIRTLSCPEYWFGDRILQFWSKRLSLLEEKNLVTPTVEYIQYLRLIEDTLSVRANCYEPSRDKILISLLT